MNTSTKIEAAQEGVVASNSLLGYGLHMPIGSVQIVAVDDGDTDTWDGVPMDSILIDRTICKIRRSQYPSLIEALRKHAA